MGSIGLHVAQRDLDDASMVDKHHDTGGQDWVMEHERVVAAGLQAGGRNCSLY